MSGDYLVGEEESILAGQTNQDGLYAEALDQFGPALELLARAYESDPDKRRDLRFFNPGNLSSPSTGESSSQSGVPPEE
jgi:hypothetical protein